MASIRKRGGKWQVQIRRADHSAISKTFTLRKDALEWARDLERQADRGDLPKDTKVLSQLTLGDLVRRYRDAVSIHKAGYENECIVFNAFLKHPICSKRLAELRTEDFAEYRDERLRTVKPTTLKRQLNPIHHAFEVARDEWGLPIKINPLRKLKLKLNEKARERRLRPGEEERLMAATAKCRNGVVLPVTMFALATAMRRGEVLAMTWTDVDLGCLGARSRSRLRS
jgi:integrase